MVKIGRITRYLIGNVRRDGVEHCARAVRDRTLQERRVHNSVALYVSEDGDVYAPCAEGQTARFVAKHFPAWRVCRYRFKPPLPKAAGRRAVIENTPVEGTTPTVDDIADDIRFHVRNASREAKAA